MKAEPIGDWEKHTKGIGLKLLQKFGFKGRLGLHETGTNRSIDVVVRPTNLGLGYGDLVDSNKSKNKKQGERQGKLDDEIEDLKSWKKLKVTDSNSGTSKSKSNRRKITNVDEFIAQALDRSDDKVNGPQHQVIIDMRNKETKIITNLNELNTSAEDIMNNQFESIVPRLGQELIYNINMISDLLDVEVTKNIHSLGKIRNKVSGAEAELNRVRNQIDLDTEKISRLESISIILNRIQSKLSENGDEHSIEVKDITYLIKSMHQNFGEEFKIFGFINLLPNLLSKTINPLDWNPLETPEVIMDLYMSLQPIVEYLQTAGDPPLANHTVSIIQSVFETRFLSIIRRTLTNDWDIQHESNNNSIKLIQYCKEILSPQSFTQLVDLVIMPKFHATVSDWRPSFHQFIHHWIMPWLPILQTKLSDLFPEIRRKLSQFLTSSWKTHQQSSAVILLLKPWIKVFDANSFENLILRAVIPKLLYILRDEFRISPSNQDLNPFQTVIEWVDLITIHQLSSLLLGEFFPSWLRVLFKWLSAFDADFSEISIWYSGWKSMFPQVILDVEEVGEAFNVALQMMQSRLMIGDCPDEKSFKNSNDFHHFFEKFDSMVLKYESRDYFQIINDKKVEKRALDRLLELNKHNRFDPSVMMKASGGGGVSGMSTSSLKELISTVAEKNEIEFNPMIGKEIEHKQLWNFGGIIIYFEDNVIYRKVTPRDSLMDLKLGKWDPISVDDLLKESVNKK